MYTVYMMMTRHTDTNKTGETTMTQIQKDMRLLLNSGNILRVVSLAFSSPEIEIEDEVVLAGTRTYKDSQARSTIKLSTLISKIASHEMKIVQTKLGDQGNTNWRPEVVA